MTYQSVTYETNRPTLPFASESLPEITLDALNPSDHLLIKTVNSTYCFMVVDPSRGLGLLTGGVLGSTAVETVFLGAQILHPSGMASCLLSKLREGAQAIFFLVAGDPVEQLVTSTIIKLVHRH